MGKKYVVTGEDFNDGTIVTVEELAFIKGLKSYIDNAISSAISAQ